MMYEIRVQHYTGHIQTFHVEHHEPPSIDEGLTFLKNYLGNKASYYNLHSLIIVNGPKVIHMGNYL